MKINKVSVNHFGKLGNVNVSFTDGINIVSGNNESGKSTLHAFIESMLFGVERGKGRGARQDQYNHFLPWNGGTYGGAIEIEKDGDNFMLSRNFSKDSPSLVIRNTTRSENVEPSEQVLNNLTCNLTRPLYNNTISVGQLSVNTGEDLSTALKNHIVNLQSSGSFNIDVNDAISSLQTEKKHLDQGFSKTSLSKAEEIANRINELEEDISKSNAIINLKEAAKNKKTFDARISELEKQKSETIKLVVNGEQLIRKQHIGDFNDIVLRTDETDAVCNKLEDYFSKHNFNLSKGARAFYVGFLIFFILLFGASLLFGGVYYYKYGFDIKGLVPYIAACLVSLVFIIFNSHGLRSIARLRRFMLDFSNLHKEYYGTIPEVINMELISEVRKRPRSLLSLLESIEQSKNRLKEIDAELEKKRPEAGKLLEELDACKKDVWNFEQLLSEENSCYRQLGELREQLNKNKNIKRHSAAIESAISTIKSLSTNVFDSFGQYIEKRISSIIKDMTDGAYEGVDIDENLEIRLIENGRRVDISCVSTGTLDQVFLALRLAIVEFFWPDEDMPILLDDTFAMYDGKRLANTLRYLAGYYPGQVIILSCHTREAEIASDLGIPYNLINL